MSSLTQEQLKGLLRYDPETGVFTRIGQTGTRCDLVGATAGGPTSDGYWRIAVDGARYKAHRLAWFYVTGRWPDPEVDHRNGVGTDNHWSNLREATSAINKQNRRAANKNNKLGLMGVSRAPAGKYRARINAKYLGVFNTPGAANDAYLKAKRLEHEGCTI